MKPSVRYCAIYTRKSSEEGLDMEFNSLDAQRESCAAYIASQKAEGWQPVKTHYDDGGFSGGNVDRPGLKQLMADIEAGKIHIVVVYKIDRLTRSLMDFSKLVETFDKHGVTFVSITQSFNTTTSMGRLTLNVLLSFAQFEREVTGERIRDKIAASKKKGMWMGGVAPIGYKSQDRRLVPDPENALKVQHIFERYEHWGCVAKLKAELDRNKILTRTWISAKGIVHEQASFSRGILYKILRNPAYIGQIAHKEKIYDGQHDSIIDRDLWDKVRIKLANNAAQPRGQKKVSETELLKGLLFDPDGTHYSPTYTLKNGRRYRYYVSQNLIQYRDHPKGVIARLPASELEELVSKELVSLFTPKNLADIFDLDEDSAIIRHICEGKDLRRSAELLTMIAARIVIRDGGVSIKINTCALRSWLTQIYSVALPEPIKPDHEIEAPFVVGRAKTGSLILSPANETCNIHDPFDRPESEIRAWVQGIIWRDAHFGGKPLQHIADSEGVSTTHILKYINKALEVA
jgi:site-specific DNA recombinase